MTKLFSTQVDVFRKPNGEIISVERNKFSQGDEFVKVETLGGFYDLKDVPETVLSTVERQELGLVTNNER